MKKISSTMLIFFLGLLIFVVGFTTIWNFSLLKSETKAQTLQQEITQTESIGKPLLNQINGIRSLITDRQLGGEALNERKELGIEQTYPLIKQGTGWVVDSVPATDDVLLKLIGKLSGTGIKLYPYNADNHLIVLTSLSASTGTLAVVNISPIFRDCEGQGAGIINDDGALLLSCDITLKNTVFSPSSNSMKRIRESKFSAGSFESIEDAEPYLFSYYQPNSILSVVGATASKVAFRPAYFMGLRMVLLILCGFGVAMLMSVFLARSVTGPIELVIDATSRIASGDFDFPLEFNGKNELRTLVDSVKRMSGQIKNLVLSEVEKTKIQEQLALAGDLQRTLLPPASVDLFGYHIESLYIPADQCGGDWWAYIECGTKLIVLIGDVTGHGYPSALLVAATRGGIAMVEAQLEIDGPAACDPAKILMTLNRVVYDSAQAQLSMTAQCVVIDRDSGEFTMANAAHPNAFFVQKSDHTLQPISLSGTRLGETRILQTVLEEATGQLLEREKLILYTDGLQELGTEEKQLDKKGVVRFFRSVTQSSAVEIAMEVQNKLLPMNEGLPLRDDITLVIVERLDHA